MNKDIKSLISEAFEELYQEMVNEAPQTMMRTKILDNEVNSIIQNSMKRGTAVPNKFTSEDVKSRTNFDTIIDALMDDYKKTGNPKSREAIQASFYPSPGSKMLRSVGSKFIGNPELEDAAASAYEQVAINNFDKIASAYKVGTRGLGALMTSDMRNKVYNYIVGGYRGTGAGGGSLDAVGGSQKALSLDKPFGDSGESTFGDKIASSMGISPETALEKGFSQEEKLATQRQIIKDVTQWLDNKFDEEGNEMGKRRMAAFKGLMAGDSAEDIVSDYPEYFKEPRLVTQEFSRLVNSAEAQEISDMISHIYGINFNLANVDPKKLKQTSSMNPEFGGFSKMVRQATPEMEAAQSELSNALAVVGLKLPQFSSTKNKEQVIADLQSKGMTDELEAILNADEELERVTERAKAQGKYQQFEPVLPSSPEEEEKSGEMFEGFSMDKLMERVYKRIMK
jgi:hypothetical protein